MEGSCGARCTAVQQRCIPLATHHARDQHNGDMKPSEALHTIRRQERSRQIDAERQKLRQFRMYKFERTSHANSPQDQQHHAPPRVLTNSYTFTSERCLTPERCNRCWGASSSSSRVSRTASSIKKKTASDLGG